MKRLSSSPASARCSVRAARKMVSPSGTHVLRKVVEFVLRGQGSSRDAAHLKTGGGCNEATLRSEERRAVQGTGGARDGVALRHSRPPEGSRVRPARVGRQS